MNSNPAVAFFMGRAAAGGDGGPSSNNAGAALDASMAGSAARVSGQIEVDKWRVYANRLNVNLAAHKMSEATLLAELKKANIDHPMATEEGFQALFEKMLADQYGVGDLAMAKDERSPFEQKSLDEVGKERADVK